MRAKSFFYVCAGVFLLALGYHLGARTAGAQVGPGFRVLGSSPLTIETAGQVYFLAGGGWLTPSQLPPVPVSSLQAGDPGAYVTADGTAWIVNGSGGWESYALPGLPTPAQRESMGQLKARYR